MGTTLKHLVMGGLGGTMLAVAVWLCWWVGSLLLGAAALDELHTLFLALGVGCVSSALVAACLSLAWQRSARQQQRLDQIQTDLQKRTPPTQKHKIVPPRASQKRRLHPIQRHDLRARISATLRWVSISRPLQGLLRLPPEQMLGKSIFEMLHPEDIPALDRTLQEARATRQVRQLLCRFQVNELAPSERPGPAPTFQSDTKLLPALHPKSFLHLRLSVWARKDRAGKVRGYLCLFADWTEEMLRHEQELRTARKIMSRAKKYWRIMSNDLARLKLSYQELYHNAPVMYFSINTEGQLITFNDTLLRTLGYERKDLRGGSYTVLLDPAGVKPGTPFLASSPWQDGEFETQWRNKDGTLLDVWIHTIQVFDEQGNFVRYRSAALDLTEKNRLSNELRARGDELERMNQRLRQTNTELEDFTHVVSHDLKEPLRTLQAYSHILAEEHAARLGPDGFQYINHLIRASRRLGILIDELLQLSQAGRITRKPQEFNLIEIVATVRQDLVDLIQRKQASLIAESSLPNVIGDPVRVTQLLSNLVANGLKYNQAEAPQVTIGAQPCMEDPSRVTIFVRDNGIGIDPAFHQQIFGIFRRLHQPGEYEGTGAGLAICKKIVEGHGGRIWVESQPGQGATFFFTLPKDQTDGDRPARNGILTLALERKAEETRPARPPHPSNPIERAHGGNGAPRSTQIVLVDDQPEVGMIIQKLGKRDGLTITWFPTAEEAWQHLQEDCPDLLLLDVNLPGMSGVELCQRIRTLAHLKDTPVAIFTPEQEPEQLQKLRAAGANFFLTKDLLCQPILWQQKIQELLEQIRRPLVR